MRYSAEQKLETRARIVEASGRAFRRHGYSGIGVDGLAREAGVTSGAFYGHFKSKDEAFREIAVGGLEDLATAIEALQAEHGAAWIEPFIDFYLGERRTCDLGQSCALQSLTADVMRADETVRAHYEAAFTAVVEAVAQGLTGLARDLAHERALALLALLSGGVTLARSVASPRMSEGMARALRAGAMALLHQS